MITSVHGRAEPRTYLVLVKVGLVVIAVASATLARNAYLFWRGSSDFEERRTSVLHMDILFQRRMPKLHARDLGGNPVLVPRASNRPSLLVFFREDCRVCLPGLMETASLPASVRSLVDVVGLSTDRLPALQSFQSRQALPFPVLHIEEREQQQAGVHGSPTFLLVDAQGRIKFAQSGVISEGTVWRMRDKIARELGRSSVWEREEARPTRGQVAPALTLQDSSGSRITTELLAGSPYLLVFISPNCEGCESVWPAIAQARIHSGQSMKIVLNFGDVPIPIAADFVNRSMERQHSTKVGLTIATDPGLTTQQAFGALTIPSAVWVSSDGRIVESDAGVGTSSVIRHFAKEVMKPKNQRPPRSFR